ncbi:MAG: ATP-binding cassette domain-containing protein [Dehalococcoidia bacterium]|nr:ATP-binding cassette domain-containing protein [Dehalococcoidia bacterium]
MLRARIKRSLPGFELNVELSLERELMAILGPSGSGKTMTLQCIAGLTKPDEGYIELDGQVLFDSTARVNLPPQKRRVGFVFQNYALFPLMTVAENIAYSIRCLPKSEIRAKISHLLNIMNISPLSERYPRQLSAGQQQRAAIARALAPDPAMLLLDEPFSALDPQLKERLELELLALQQGYQGSMLLVTHDLAEGYKLGGRVAVYHGGSIAQCDTRQRVFSTPVNRTVARLTGVHNFMDGEISRLEPPFGWVNIPAWNMQLKAHLPASGLSIGRQVVLGIRPEYIQINPPARATNMIGARVLQAVEGIASVTYRLLVDGDWRERHLLNSLLPKADEQLLAEKEPCQLHLPPEHLIVIPE